MNKYEMNLRLKQRVHSAKKVHFISTLNIKLLRFFKSKYKQIYSQVQRLSKTETIVILDLHILFGSLKKYINEWQSFYISFGCQ
jgi:hypothetical protein